MNDNYVYPDMAIKLSEYIKKRHEAGAYLYADSMRDFARLLNNDLYSICEDRHCDLTLGEDIAVTKESWQLRKQHLLETNYGFNKVSCLQGNIGYLMITEFYNSDNTIEVMDQVFDEIADVDALIIDLRENEGGSTDIVTMLCSYFFNDPVHIFSIENPRTGKITETWTTKEVKGKKIIDVPIYILISGKTFSAAECFAYTLQTLKKAIVIGQYSAGGAHPTKSFVIKEFSIVFDVPVHNLINPITRTNWERTGIRPDVEIHYLEAFDKAIELARIQIRTLN